MVLACLSEITGFTAEQLARRLIGMGSDGAPVMTGVCWVWGHAGYALPTVFFCALCAGHAGGLAQLLRQQAAPWLLNYHCAAHRLALEAGALKDNPLVVQLTALLNSANTHFCKSPVREKALRDTAIRLKAPPLAVLRLVPTRWLCIFPVLSRLLDIYPTLILYSHEQQDDILLAQLSNLTTILAGYTLLPLLQRLNSFCLACQVWGVLAGELSQLMRALLESIKAMCGVVPTSSYKEASSNWQPSPTTTWQILLHERGSGSGAPAQYFGCADFWQAGIL
jgi:hypothetical protein